MSIEIADIVESRGHRWAVTALEPNPQGWPPLLRISRLTHEGATSLVVGSAELIARPTFPTGMRVRFALDESGVVIRDEGQFVQVESERPCPAALTPERSRPHEQFKRTFVTPCPRGDLVRDNIAALLRQGE